MVDVESDDPVKQSELEELKNKVSKMNKNLITIMNTVKNIEYNLNNKKEENKENTNDKDKDKERINKAFEKKQIGRPVGSWEDKRKQYFEWITTGKSLNSNIRFSNLDSSTTRCNFLKPDWWILGYFCHKMLPSIGWYYIPSHSRSLS